MLNKSDKLKPCPFCGGEAKIGYYQSPIKKDNVQCYIFCIVCEASNYNSVSFKPEAIESWNRRV